MESASLIQIGQLINILLLGGLLGMTGQGIRAIAGYKKLQNQALQVNLTINQLFDLHVFLISLFIGFIAGILCVLGLFDKFKSGVDPNNLEPLLIIIAAGYAGTDFIEAFIKKKIPIQLIVPLKENS